MIVIKTKSPLVTDLFFLQDITAFEGVSFTIDVVGDGLEFMDRPTTILVNTDISPSIRVANTDSNGNLDLSNSGENVSVTSTGTLMESPFDIPQKRMLFISEIVDPSDNIDDRYVELFNIDVEALDLGDKNHNLHTPIGNGQSIQLTGVIPPKSYYIISLTDAATFNGIYDVNPDFEASIFIMSGDQDAYYISFANTEQSLMAVYGVLSEFGTTGTTWEFPSSRAYRNYPIVREANPVYDPTEWTKFSATTCDATIGIGDNDFFYKGNWTTSGLGDPEAIPYDGANTDKSIFIESAETTLSEIDIMSDVVVRAGATLFDGTLTGNPFMFGWNAANAQWSAISNTDTKTFKVGDTHVISVRGDRSARLNSNTAVGPATTLRATGELAISLKTVTNLSSNLGGFSLISNPYQVKVNMADLLFSGNSSGVRS